MKDNNGKPWYEKISIWITIIAGICGILGISIFSNISFIEDNNGKDSFINSGNDQQTLNDIPLSNDDIQPEEKDDASQDESYNVVETNEEVTSQQYSIYDENNQLKDENAEKQNSDLELKNEIENLQDKNSELEKNIKKLQNQNSACEDKIANLQNELDKYITKYGIISEDDFEMVSIFSLETFQGGEHWWNTSDISDFKSISDNNFIDTYGNKYPEANLAEHFRLNEKNKYAPTYLLNYNYSKCEGKIAWPKSDKNVDGAVWIEFYSNDELFYQTEQMYASDGVLDFEFSVEGVEKLTIVKKASNQTGIIYIIYPYFNFVK